MARFAALASMLSRSALYRRSSVQGRARSARSAVIQIGRKALES
jgi:hypothetical protein